MSAWRTYVDAYRKRHNAPLKDALQACSKTYRSSHAWPEGITVLRNPDFKGATDHGDLAKDRQKFHRAEMAIMKHWDNLCTRKNGNEALSTDYKKETRFSFEPDLELQGQPEYIVYSGELHALEGFATLYTKDLYYPPTPNLVRNSVLPPGFKFKRKKKVIENKDNGLQYKNDAQTKTELWDTYDELRMKDYNAVIAIRKRKKVDVKSTTLYLSLICSKAGQKKGRSIMKAIDILGSQLRKEGLIESLSTRAAVRDLIKNVYEPYGYKEHVASRTLTNAQSEAVYNELNRSENQKEYFLGRWMSKLLP